MNGKYRRPGVARLLLKINFDLWVGVKDRAKRKNNHFTAGKDFYYLIRKYALIEHYNQDYMVKVENILRRYGIKVIIKKKEGTSGIR